MRSGKSPFTVLSPETTLAQDVLHGNVGNHLYSHAVFKALLVPGSEIVSNSNLSETQAATQRDCARVNERFDAFVVPLANAFRPGFRRRLANLTTFVRGLNIPVVVVGVGAQVDGLSNDEGALEHIGPEVKDFVSAVLERSESIGVRGELTQRYLRKLGFPDSAVTVVGCPSLFLHGPGFRLPTPSHTLDADSQIAFNYTPRVERITQILKQQMAKYRHLTLIVQDRATLSLMLWGDEPPTIEDEDSPVHTAHALYQQDRMRLFLDPWPWMDYLARHDFTFGTRFHGNVAALLARSPAMLLAHDSRTVELAEYHGIPHRLINQVSEQVDATELLEQFDPGPFNAVYDERFRTYLDFLERDKLSHVYQQGLEDHRFADTIASTAFAPAVGTLCGPVSEGTAARLRWLRDQRPFDASLHSQAYRPPFPFPAPPPGAKQVKRLAADEVSDLRDVVSKQRKQLREQMRRQTRKQEETLSGQADKLRRQQQRIDGLTERLSAEEQRTLRRRLARAVGRGRRDDGRT